MSTPMENGTMSICHELEKLGCKAMKIRVTDPETGKVFEVELEGSTVKSMRRVEE